MSKLGALHTHIDAWLRNLSTGWLPALIALFSVLALTLLPSQYTAAPHGQQPFQLAPQSAPDWTLADATAALQDVPPALLWQSQLSTDPVWVQVAADSRSTATVLEFPSRHATELQCWNATDGRWLGSAGRDQVSGAMLASRGGFALALEASVRSVVCQVTFRGPARFSVEQWEPAELAIANREFHRNAGLLDGGMLVLAAFILIAGLLNRDNHYLLFASWLILNLRMAALSAGWDQQWLGHTVPYAVLQHLRPITIALYYSVTIVLFRQLFIDQLTRLGRTGIINAVQLSTLPILLLSVILSYEDFLPIVWAATTVGVVVYIYLLAQILMATQSRVALWYAASIGVALVASVYEVAAAALGLTALIGSLNSVTAALASSVLTALAVAERMREEHAEKLQVQAELQHTFDVIPIGLFTLNEDGRFLGANPALVDMLGPEVQAPGSDSWPARFGRGPWEQLAEAARAEGGAELEVTDGGQHGQDPRHFLVKATWSKGKVEGSLQDISTTVRAKTRLEFLANHDPLTTVLNRRGTELALDEALRHLRSGQPLAVAYLDLDRFKLINDLYGHNAGDEVLRQVCGRIVQRLSGQMVVGRVGGDEFLLVMPGTPLPQAEAVCRSIVTALGNEPYSVGERAFQVRVSIGLIEVHPDLGPKEVVSTADRACREAKKGRSSSLQVYDKASRVFSENEAELQLVERLATGQSIDGLFLEMQPILSLRNPYASLNFEVLLRMQDATGGRVPTERLINAGEHAGRMSAIDRWVLTTTLSWLQQHQSRMEANHFVCVNLSGASLNDERFVQFVYDQLQTAGPVSRRLCLEITESVALHDMGNTRRFIDRVRGFGARIALDDFGAGYTSFSYLKELPADLLKIDGSFIVNMNRHPANVAIVEAIVSLAQNLGMKTIAEWAEDAETVQTLAEIGVDYVQGFVVARPQAPHDILGATSAADFIRDDALNHYLSDLKPTEGELEGVDWVLGTDSIPSAGAGTASQP